MYLEEKNFLRLERDRFKDHSIVKVFVYKCSKEDCINELRIQQSHLKKHKGKCRVCIQQGKPFEALFNELKKSAYRRNIQVTLTYEEFILFTKIKNCWYCGDTLTWNKHSRDNGKVLSRSYKIDRKNNKLGYCFDNCVPCCFKCNQFKSHYFNDIEFINHCIKISKYNE